MLKVKDRMAPKLNTIPEGASALDAAKYLTERRYSSIFIARGEQVIGMLTDTDLVHKVMAVGADSAKTKVETIMTTTLFSIDLNAALTEANDMMDKHRLRHLAVTENGKIISVISIRDLIHPAYTDGEGW